MLLFIAMSLPRPCQFAQFDDGEADECEPIKCLCDLFSWMPPTWRARPPPPIAKRTPAAVWGNWEKFEDLRSANISVPDAKPPKTLFCHDFKGGYREDRFVEGTHINQYPYLFLHWSLIDTFVYFSHHLITIPPPGWIAAAHRNGVKVLGTIITEFDEGRRVCSDILRDDESVTAFVEKCVEIADVHGFDGWLVNIENALDKEAGEVSRMVDLVRQLTHKIHKRLGADRGEVIWYDAVTVGGELQWQDELNDENGDFWAACDGIFLNYTWKCNDVKNSLKNSMDFCDFMVGDYSSVYVGIDVFGRNCFGGFDSAKALSMIRSECRSRGGDGQLSVAIFAPGWTHESMDFDEENALYRDLIEFREVFLNRDASFWASLQPLLRVHGPAFEKSQAATLASKKNLVLQFSTSLHMGCVFDTCRRSYWAFNLSRQQIQLSHRNTDEISYTGEIHLIAPVETVVPLLICSFPRVTENGKFMIILKHSEKREKVLLNIIGDGKALEIAPAAPSSVEQREEYEEEQRMERSLATYVIPADFAVVNAIGIRRVKPKYPMRLKLIMVAEAPNYYSKPQGN